MKWGLIRHHVYEIFLYLTSELHSTDLTYSVLDTTMNRPRVLHFRKSSFIMTWIWMALNLDCFISDRFSLRQAWRPESIQQIPFFHIATLSPLRLTFPLRISHSTNVRNEISRQYVIIGLTMRWKYYSTSTDLWSG